MASAQKIYRVLYAVKSAPPGDGPDSPESSLVSVSVPADHPQAAQQLASQLLSPQGIQTVGNPIRTSNLTELLRDASANADDSGYGECAAQWLLEIHDEAVREGSSIQLLSSNYDFLQKPRRVPPGRNAG